MGLMIWMIKQLTVLLILLIVITVGASEVGPRRNGKYTFVVQTISEFIEDKVNLVIALTTEEICDDSMVGAIQRALSQGHSIVLSAPNIPQSNSRGDLSEFNEYLATASDCLRDKFSYRLKLVYNLNKATVLKSVNDKIKKNGMNLFTRSYRSHLRRPKSIQRQLMKSHRDEHLVIQIELKDKTDLERLEVFSETLENLGYTRTVDAKSFRMTFIADGFINDDEAQNELFKSKAVKKFTVTMDDIVNNQGRIRAALQAGMTPIFRFNPSYDNSLGRLKKEKLRGLIIHVMEAKALFQHLFPAKLKEILIPFTSINTEKIEKELDDVGFTAVHNDMNIIANTADHRDCFKANDDGSIVCIRFRDYENFKQTAELASSLYPIAVTVEPEKIKGTETRNNKNLARRKDQFDISEQLLLLLISSR